MILLAPPPMVASGVLRSWDASIMNFATVALAHSHQTDKLYCRLLLIGWGNIVIKSTKHFQFTGLPVQVPSVSAIGTRLNVAF
jgi:hypothetical protein